MGLDCALLFGGQPETLRELQKCQSHLIFPCQSHFARHYFRSTLMAIVSTAHTRCFTAITETFASKHLTSTFHPTASSSQHQFHPNTTRASSSSLSPLSHAGHSSLRSAANTTFDPSTIAHNTSAPAVSPAWQMPKRLDHSILRLSSDFERTGCDTTPIFLKPLGPQTRAFARVLRIQ